MSDGEVEQAGDRPAVESIEGRGVRAAHVAKASLLVVDDESALMQALCNILSQQGYATTGCVTATEALAHLRAHRYDLMLTDLMMPGIDGLALARQARALDEQMAVVMMTGEGSIGTAVEAMQSGVLDYVLKPFRLGTMLPVLDRALSIGQLRRENLRLQRQVEQHARELETTNVELEAYASTVSHDLRAPLRGIDGLAKLLTARLGNGLDSETRRALEMIGASAVRAQRLVHDLLRLSRLGRQEIARDRVDLGALAREVGSELCSGRQLPESTVVVSPELGTACGDEALLRQVFVNLIDNALKFSGGQREPRVEVRRDPKQSDRAVFMVADNGPGFDMNRSASLFMPFERMQGSERFEGNGLGLSIVQRIVLRHGGRVWAESSPGAGARFYFTLEP